MINLHLGQVDISCLMGFWVMSMYERHNLLIHRAQWNLTAKVNPKWSLCGKTFPIQYRVIIPGGKSIRLTDPIPSNADNWTNRHDTLTMWPGDINFFISGNSPNPQATTSKHQLLIHRPKCDQRLSQNTIGYKVDKKRKTNFHESFFMKLGHFTKNNFHRIINWTIPKFKHIISFLLRLLPHDLGLHYIVGHSNRHKSRYPVKQSIPI